MARLDPDTDDGGIPDGDLAAGSMNPQDAGDDLPYLRGQDLGGACRCDNRPSTQGTWVLMLLAGMLGLRRRRSMWANSIPQS